MTSRVTRGRGGRRRRRSEGEEKDDKGSIKTKLVLKFGTGTSPSAWYTGIASIEDAGIADMMLYLATVAAVAVATTGKPYRPPRDIPPAEGLDNPNAGQKNEKIDHFVVLFMENRTRELKAARIHGRFARPSRRPHSAACLVSTLTV